MTDDTLLMGISEAPSNFKLFKNMKMNLLDDTEDIFTPTISVNKPIVVETIEEEKPKEKEFIKKEVFIDKFTTKRVRIELTPSICRICGLDIAEFNGLGSWYRVPEDRKSSILAALKEHKKVVHPIREDLIVTESQLPTEWLGDKNVTL